MPASVVVPARNAAATLGRTLDAVAAQEAAGLEVIVVDDGSSDGTVALAQAHPVVSRVLRAGPGAGPGAARNAGAAAASGDVLVFLDSDCFPVAGWLEAGLRALSDADLVQGRVEPDPGGRRSPFERTLSVPAAYGLFESANLFVRRDAFEAAGGFGGGLEAPAESFAGVVVGEKRLAEDVLFGWTLRRAGRRTAFAGDALVHHAVFGRGPRGFAAERRRLRHFPAIARQVPELRDTFFSRRVFLTPRTADFDLAVAGLAAAPLLPVAALAAAPYARRLWRDARNWPQVPARTVVAAGVVADAVGLVALVRGSIAARTVVL